MLQFTEEMKTAGFEIIPEGEHILKVEEMKPVMQAGKLKKLKVTFVDAKGRKLFNTYDVDPKGKYYVQSMKAMYSLLTTGCGLKPGADGSIDEADAVGKYVIAEVRHNTSESTGRTYANLGYINGHAEGFEGEEPVEDVYDEEDPYA